MSEFTPDFLTFFEELAGDNTKDWFDANRVRYHQVIKNPRYAFVQKVIDAVAKEEQDFFLEPKDAVFRINRDTRFSKNKQPYKTHVAAVISKGGRKVLAYPGLYIHLGQDGLHMGGGCYNPDKDEISLIRKAFIAHPEQVDLLLQDVRFTKLFGTLQGEQHKRLPKEFQPYLETIPLLANKQFFFYTKYPPQDILRDDLLAFVMQHRYAAKPWNAFLQQAIGLE